MPNGETPNGPALESSVALRLPLHAFSILQGGDAFDVRGGQPPPQGAAQARAYLGSHVEFITHRTKATVVGQVKASLVQQLQGNLQLIARLAAGRPLTIELIPEGASMAAYGYPKGVARTAAGLFWDRPDWPKARIALRQDRLHEPALVEHEMAHAIFYLAFTQKEREAVYQVMWRTYRHRALIDEVFAIYSEREFLPGFSDELKHAPGVYGTARQRWSEDHLFTRFVRQLYTPYKPLAGPRGSLDL